MSFDMTPAGIGAELKLIREQARKMSPEDVARLAAVPINDLLEIERGERMPADFELSALMAVYQIAMERADAPYGGYAYFHDVSSTVVPDPDRTRMRDHIVDLVVAGYLRDECSTGWLRDFSAYMGIPFDEVFAKVLEQDSNHSITGD